MAKNLSARNSDPPAENKQKETFDPKTGQPTRRMTRDEYREWVLQTVSGHIWRRIVAILSFVGIAAIYGVWTYTASVSNSQIDSRFKELASDHKVKSIESSAQLKSDFESLRNSLTRQVGAEIESQIRTNKLVPQIVEGAVEQTVAVLRTGDVLNDQLRNLIVSRARTILKGDIAADESLRDLALQQVLLFGDHEQQAEAITLIFGNQKIEARTFQLALRSYRTPQAGGNQIGLLPLILQRAVDQPSDFTDASWTAVQNILKEAKLINVACEWVRINSGKLGGSADDPIKTIVKNIALAGGLSAATEFVGWLDRGGELANLGLYGLTELRLPSTASAPDNERYTLIRKAINALARADQELDGLSDYLASLFAAIRRNEREAVLRQYAASDFANQRIRELISDLGRGLDSRSPRARADRDFNSEEQLREYAQYPKRGFGAEAFRGLASLLDVNEKSEDWDHLILPAIEETKKDGGRWTSPGPARFLVHAWVQKLQDASPPQSSINKAVDLFIDAHLSNEANVLLSDNFKFLLYLAGRASSDRIRKFLEHAPGVTGGPERGGERGDQLLREIQDENEAVILAEFLGRGERTQVMTEELLTGMRKALGDRPQRGQATWFHAISRLANLRDGPSREADYRGIVRSLAATARKSKTGGTRLSVDAAINSLFLVTNASFLSNQAVLGAAEIANLHTIGRDTKQQGIPEILQRRSQIIEADVRNSLKWIGTLPSTAVPVDTHFEIPANRDEIWLSFDARSTTHLAQFAVEPPRRLSYLLVDSAERVIDAATLSTIRDTQAMLVDLHVPSPGKHYLRFIFERRGDATSAPAAEAINLKLKYDVELARAFPSTREGTIRPAPENFVVVGTAGNDAAWFRLNVKANAAYVLRTHTLRSAQGLVDTVIEVYRNDEKTRLYRDDDGGSARGGEIFSSFVSFTPSSDAVYHVRIGNISSARGTYVFELSERLK